MLPLCAALLLGQTLVPSPELAAKLADIEARRPALESRRNVATGLRVAAYSTYVLSLAAVGWMIAELVLEGGKRAPEPLAGTPKPNNVAPAVPGLIAVGVFAVGAILHVTATVMDWNTDAAEFDLADEERLWRWKLRPPDAE
ncbi:MAG: hypothetical protein JNK82_35140 [Myxococcaceae bacterium]|nr:hypothetical protein [Myxococcaceae bacterium]